MGASPCSFCGVSGRALFDYSGLTMGASPCSFCGISGGSLFDASGLTMGGMTILGGVTQEILIIHNRVHAGKRNKHPTE